MTGQGVQSIEIRWTEPRCKTSATLLRYVVAVNDEMDIPIELDCLTPSGVDSVALVLNDTTCGLSDFVDFSSCTPYEISIRPVYELASANEEIIGRKTATNTLADEFEASVNNVTVTDTGSRWISLSWPKPECRMPIGWWTLSDVNSGCASTLAADIPLLVNDTTYQLNISDQMDCGNNASPIIPCSNYSIQLDVKFLDLDFQPGTNNIAHASSQSEGITRYSFAFSFLFI